MAVLQQQIGRALLWLRPDGWQVKARRNAWAAMVADSQRRRDRASVDREARLASSEGQRRVQAR